MSSELWGAVIGLIAGAISYYFAEFHMSPVLRFRELKAKVHADLIFFANAVNADGLDEEMQGRVRDRTIANRRHSAELRALYESMPWWYRKWLYNGGVDLPTATKDLIGLSNTFEYETASKRVERICKSLKLPSPF